MSSGKGADNTVNDGRKRSAEEQKAIEEYSDDKLIEQIKSGDEYAAEVLINRYYAAIGIWERVRVRTP